MLVHNGRKIMVIFVIVGFVIFTKKSRERDVYKNFQLIDKGKNTVKLWKFTKGKDSNKVIRFGFITCDTRTREKDTEKDRDTERRVVDSVVRGLIFDTTDSINNCTCRDFEPRSLKLTHISSTPGPLKIKLSWGQLKLSQQGTYCHFLSFVTIFCYYK